MYLRQREKNCKGRKAKKKVIVAPDVKIIKADSQHSQGIAE